MGVERSQKFNYGRRETSEIQFESLFLPPPPPLKIILNIKLYTQWGGIAQWVSRLPLMLGIRVQILVGGLNWVTPIHE